MSLVGRPAGIAEGAEQPAERKAVYRHFYPYRWHLLAPPRCLGPTILGDTILYWSCPVSVDS